MKKYVILAVLAAFAAGLMYIAALPETVFAMGMGNMMKMHKSMGHSSSAMHEMSDRHFIEMMIPHHQDAIDMAQLALQKAQRQDIKTLAQNIITSQTAEIEQMKAWYKAWYGTDVPESAMTGMHQTDMSALENVQDFDKAFIEQMIPHHSTAVMMARMLHGRAEHKELQQLAKDITRVQNQEIIQMRSWYMQWYR